MYLPLIRLTIDGEECVCCPFEMRLMRCEQASQSSPAFENGIMLAAPDREVAVRFLENLDRLVPNLEKLCDQIALLPDIGLVRLRTPLF